MKGRRGLKLKQWAAIVATSAFAGICIALYDHFFLLSPVVTGIMPSYTFIGSLLITFSASTLGGLLTGAFMVYYIQDRFSDKPYGYTVIALLLIMFAIMMVLSTIFLLFFVRQITGKPFTDPESIAMFKDLFFHKINPVFFLWVPLIAVQQLMLQIFNKFGPGVFWKIVRGKYYTPKNEDRIFMFVDLNSSTSIAEKLGNERYHELLKDFFADITNSILDHSGEIYQYLGDGIIIAWNSYGDERDLRCIHCFFDMKKEIRERSDKYQKKFGLVPGFKAGMHAGKVVVGEIGIIKRDITYSGDVMNTTARIQSMCGELNKEALLSSEFLHRISLPSIYSAASVGAIHLKGKEKDVELCSVEMS